MSELLTASYTIGIGVAVYTLGQIIVKFIIEPVQEQKRITGEILDALIYYADIISSPSGANGRRVEGSARLRQLATLLASKSRLIPFYGGLEKIRIVHKWSDILHTAGYLIGLSNSVNVDPDNTREIIRENAALVNKISRALKLKIEQD